MSNHLLFCGRTKLNHLYIWHRRTKQKALVPHREFHLFHFYQPNSLFCFIVFPLCEYFVFVLFNQIQTFYPVDWIIAQFFSDKYLIFLCVIHGCFCYLFVWVFFFFCLLVLLGSTQKHNAPWRIRIIIMLGIIKLLLFRWTKTFTV